MARDSFSGGAGDGHRASAAILAVDAATIAQTIRAQRALPLTQAEADTLARSIEEALSDEECLASTLAALRLLADRLEPPGGVVDGDHDERAPRVSARARPGSRPRS